MRGAREMEASRGARWSEAGLARGASGGAA